MRLRLDDIKLNAGTQPRAQIDGGTVEEYAESMQSGAKFPPVVVFYDGEAYYLADGFHRVDAAYKLGLDDIEAEIKQGTCRDAILYSVGANAAHGMRRTNEDKRRAVMRLLEDEEWSAWSDREIARRCAVSDRFVNSLRPASANASQIGERKVERNGTTYTQDTSNIGKTRAPDPVVNDMPLEEPVPAPRIIGEAKDQSELTKLRLRHDLYSALTWFFANLEGEEKENEKQAVMEWLATA